MTEERDAGSTVERPEPVPTAIAWVGVAALTVTGVLAGIVECALVPLYVGGTVFPITVVAALVTNVVLPRLARRLVPSTVAAVLPFLGWLAVIVTLTTSRPEGDVILPGGGGALEYVTYSLMLVGALAGTISIVTSVPPPARRVPPPTQENATRPPAGTSPRGRSTPR